MEDTTGHSEVSDLEKIFVIYMNKKGLYPEYFRQERDKKSDRENNKCTNRQLIEEGAKISVSPYLKKWLTSL